MSFCCHKIPFISSPRDEADQRCEGYNTALRDVPYVTDSDKSKIVFVLYRSFVCIMLLNQVSGVLGLKRRLPNFVFRLNVWY